MFQEAWSIAGSNKVQSYEGPTVASAEATKWLAVSQTMVSLGNLL
jgi:hypothetical protein